MEEFKCNGLKVDRGTWESAPCPIDCSKITDEQMRHIVEELYRRLHEDYGFSEEQIMQYAEHGDDEDVDLARWQEEEFLILKHGGKYYDDPDCVIE